MEGEFNVECIDILKKRLSEKNTLFVQDEGGYFEEMGIEWFDPISEKEIDKFEKDNNIILPEGYKEFLQISNGAVLFKDIKYGQWGCKILSIYEIIPKTSEMKNYGLDFSDSWIVFAEWLGDSDLLLFDLEKYYKENSSYIIDGQEMEKIENWKNIKGNFENWLERLIVSQGAKYWHW